MQVLVKKPYEKATLKEIDGTLESLQELVGGYIETVPMPYEIDDTITIIVDEEGLLKGKQPNLYVPQYMTAFVGTCVFVGNGDEDFESLTEEQVANALDFCVSNAI